MIRIIAPPLTLLIVACAAVAQSTPKALPAGTPAGSGWRYASSLPLIDNLRRPEGQTSRLAMAPLQNWNDPSVLKEGSAYTMWASLGMQGGGRGVAIYRLTSPDGVAWKLANGGKPVLEPGAPGDFDWYGVETPAVIKVNGKYHLYYTAYHQPDPNKGGHLFTMGHATSTDGDNWTKLGELTSLTGVVGRKEGNPWGWLARAEPAPVHVDGTFYLYFADVRCRKDDCSGTPGASRGISLATSKDGHEFKQTGSAPVLLQSPSYPEAEGWEGYSTPWVLRDGRDFLLFADVFRQVGARRFQTRIAYYRSRDGVHFDEVRRDVIGVEGHPWATMSVRAPTVIVEGGEFKMWFAGDNFDPANRPADMLGAIRSGRLRMGIGMATGPRE